MVYKAYTFNEGIWTSVPCIILYAFFQIYSLFKTFTQILNRTKRNLSEYDMIKSPEYNSV